MSINKCWKCWVVTYILIIGSVNFRLSLLPPGKTSVPEVFFNSTLVGGADDLAQLDQDGKLEGMISDCLLSPDVPDFPPPFRKPKSEEYIEVSCYS